MLENLIPGLVTVILSIPPVVIPPMVIPENQAKIMIQDVQGSVPKLNEGDATASSEQASSDSGSLSGDLNQHPPVPVQTPEKPVRSTESNDLPQQVGKDIFDDLAWCESTMTNLDGYYDGFFSILPDTWRGHGLPGNPRDHSYEVQKEGAKKIVQESGWATQFPACSRKIGVR